MEYKVTFIDGYFDVKLIGKSSVEDSAAYLDFLIAHKEWRLGSLVLSDETEIETGHLTENDHSSQLVGAAPGNIEGLD